MKKLAVIDKSESLTFKNKAERFYKKPLSLWRSEEQEQVLENIRVKMREPGFESKLISHDIAE